VSLLPLQKTILSRIKKRKEALGKRKKERKGKERKKRKGKEEEDPWNLSRE